MIRRHGSAKRWRVWSVCALALCFAPAAFGQAAGEPAPGRAAGGGGAAPGGASREMMTCYEKCELPAQCGTDQHCLRLCYKDCDYGGSARKAAPPKRPPSNADK